ncbi:MAG: DUF2442 domain-containing protein [Candidatus Kapabacteria bacterium]|jgi:hypothetical protein|nr:DUF2442 domain-containing protein [Candidatus Kapabacteria bacterium]MBV6462018.1 hypothetical protein [Flavobacteriales bacterium]WKZ76201.1 MAG: DUF2442 domain-containing protein [Vicingaceae bacterium]
MKVKNAKYIQEYIIDVFFDDETVKRIDFRNFLFSATNPMTTKYRNIELFKKVKVEYGNLSWGIDGEMELSAESLYNWND